MFRALKRLNDRLAWFEQLFLVIVVLIMVFLAFLQVVLRNVFDHGFLWGDIFLRHLVLWVGFIGASLATKDERHINIDVFGRLLKGLSRRVVRIIINLFSCIVTAFLARAATDFVINERIFGSRLFAHIPAWYFEVIIPIGFALMSLRFFFYILLSFAERSVAREEKTDHE